MIQEVERPKFRLGEGKNRPIGGHVADAPVAKALRSLAVNRCFESQLSLAKALGIKQSTVSGWYRDNRIPSPELFGNLLIFFNPNDEEREQVVEAYAKRLGEREVSSKLKISRRSMRPSNNPIDRWIKDTCKAREITMRELSEILGVVIYRNLKLKRGFYGLEFLSNMLQKLPEALSLSEEETENLSEAVVLEIQQRLEQGKRFQDSPSGYKIKKMQENLVCRTYNGYEAAIELEVSRQMVGNLRKKFGLPQLLTEENLKMLKGHLEKTRGRREKLQQSMMKKRTGNLGEGDLTIFQ